MADRRYLLAVIVRDVAWASALASSGVVGVKLALGSFESVLRPPGISWPVAWVWLGLSALLLLPAQQLPRATLLGRPHLAVRTAELHGAMVAAGAKPSRPDVGVLLKACLALAPAMFALFGALVVPVAPWLRWLLAAAFVVLLHVFLWLARGNGERTMASGNRPPSGNGPVPRPQ